MMPAAAELLLQFRKDTREQIIPFVLHIDERAAYENRARFPHRITLLLVPPVGAADHHDAASLKLVAVPARIEQSRFAFGHCIPPRVFWRSDRRHRLPRSCCY